MKVAAGILGLAALAQSASAHYIFNGLVHNGQVSQAAVRQPQDNSPVTDVNSSNMRCNIPPYPATETVTVAPGDTVGFTLSATIYHKGPAALYLGKAPSSVASWDGSGDNWFKIAEWGATFNPFGFTDTGLSQLTAKIPENTPPGEYLLRAEQIGLHNLPAEYYMSCAQIKVTGSGSGNPSKVSIPGYISASDPGVTVNIYWPVPTSYTVPGPAVWQG